MSDVQQVSYPQVMLVVGEIAEELLSHPNKAVRDQTEELLDWIDAFHREGLGRLVELIRGWRGEIFLDSVARDDIAGTFLATYDLGVSPGIDTTAEDAVAEALEEIRPFVESHGGTIVVDSVVDGVVKVQMLGSCDGCPSSTATLTGGVERSLREHWPNFRRLEVVDPNAEAAPAAAPPAAEPVQLLQIGRKKT
ncbi:MAG: NifU family protein [Acidimicrobiia bacterium]|nr:NifU family protein [Acidimicrobiia bacterium]